MLNMSGGRPDFSDNTVLNLFDDLQFSVKLARREETVFKDLEVWTGRAADAPFDHLDHYTNVTIVYNPVTTHIVGNVTLGGISYQILPTKTQGICRIAELKPDTFSCNGGLLRAQEPAMSPASGAANKSAGLKNLCSSCLEDKDAGGKQVLDIFVGFSSSAAAVAIDTNAYALSMVQSVNNGLANSNVGSVYMRLVGTGVTTHNPGIITSVLDSTYIWFANRIDSLAPDFVSMFQTATGAPGEAGGWGTVPGYSTVCDVRAPNAFRHEIGHNVGGGHCPGDGSALPYAHGFNNGNWTTHLCGNGVNFYSSPRVPDNHGIRIGDSATADMARVFGERGAEMAQHAGHRVPFYAGDSCAGIVCRPSHWGAQNELIKTVVFNTINNNQAIPDWTCPAVTGYSDYTNMSTTLVRNKTYSITITPNFSFADSKVGVWIDWNNNNRFSPSERVAVFTGKGPWTSPVTVPGGASVSRVRMRLRLQYGSAYNPDPCAGSSYSSGETEDYAVQITAPAGIATQSNGQPEVFLFPNPATDVVSIRLTPYPQTDIRVKLVDMVGQTALQSGLERKGAGEDFSLNINSLPKGVYNCVITGGRNLLFTGRIVKL